MALSFTTGGEKSGFDRSTFLSAMQNSGLTDVQSTFLIKRIVSAAPAWDSLIELSFLPNKMKDAYRQLLKIRLARL